MTTREMKIEKRGYSLLRDRNGGEWIDGVVVLPEGFVHCYAQGDERYSNRTRLNFILNGVMHTRSFKVRYSKRGMVTKAKQFVAELIQPEEERG